MRVHVFTRNKLVNLTSYLVLAIYNTMLKLKQPVFDVTFGAGER